MEGAGASLGRNWGTSYGYVVKSEEEPGVLIRVHLEQIGRAWVGQDKDMGHGKDLFRSL